MQLWGNRPFQFSSKSICTCRITGNAVYWFDLWPEGQILLGHLNKLWGTYDLRLPSVNVLTSGKLPRSYLPVNYSAMQFFAWSWKWQPRNLFLIIVLSSSLCLITWHIELGKGWIDSYVIRFRENDLAYDS